MKAKDILVIIIIAITITVLWRASEISIYGAVKPNVIDTVIAGVLTTSIFNNYKIIAKQIEFNKKDYKSEIEVYKKYSRKLERENQELRTEMMCLRVNKSEKAFFKAYNEVIKNNE